MKRSPLSPISAKRRAKLAARRACVEAVLERDRGCVFPRRAFAADFPICAPLCYGVLDVHEPGKRSQGADPTDPDQCVALCRTHHRLVHANPQLGASLGLLDSLRYPLIHVAVKGGES